ncbi:LysE family transporter [Anaeromyxobacter dehalogenans]|uniref:Lysine exporter protein (LYSE/YGGA) n=1 Tax=Anaeromyxobacter dehalogenans (strain 2CP-C) TaxID=290397 RepID=Q2INB8_ANADE|nr:LysE family transporter [Anaeromyxobacter dehalogenans]ABC80303.1 Lysine exporter protein (LYSE/YGGA) [Anaeromyxobacter dehalogenans 2CP-C]
METWIATAGLVAVGVFTPGPSNFVVMHRAAAAGLRGAAPAIAAVLLGLVALLGLAAAGGGALLAAAPALGRVLQAGGAVYLAWGGVALVVESFRRGPAEGGAAGGALPQRPAAVFLFQFTNPKAWAMVLTAASACGGGGAGAAFLRLVPLFTALSLAGLLTWAMLGSALERAMRVPRWRRRIDRAMGALLAASAALLLAGA